MKRFSFPNKIQRRIYFKEHIEPNLYLISLWLCISAGFSIFLNDIDRGVATSSAFTLYYLVNGFYRARRHNEMLIEMARGDVES